MPMITLPLIPTLFALIVFSAFATADNDEPVIELIGGLILAGVVYFAAYGLMMTVGL
jgi:hypothetical protein